LIIIVTNNISSLKLIFNLL